ncbi:TPA: polysaccharide deacetylase family protein [Burkholderia multivorans]|nr:polysaccharide deacetylase family protein [Burkholderia multivorans]
MNDTRVLKQTTLMVTVNFHGIEVDRQHAGEHALYGKFGYGRYTANIGYRRLLELFERRGIRATWFVPAVEAREHRECIKAIASAGHEIAANGFSIEDHERLGAHERARLEEAHDALSEIVGAAPRGWRSPTGTLSADTLPLLAELGYRYDSSFQDDFHPYSLADYGASSMVELPQNEMLIDATLWNVRATHDRVLKTWLEEFEAAREENCLIHLTLHPRADSGSGRASRIDVVERFLLHVLDVGVPHATALEIAG